uniref:G-protein coupled receptors family 1 profile domain-containing protein n=1 Tax=Anopheles farauti TaxID=69004 RepID=A0A182QZG0_9DIPT
MFSGRSVSTAQPEVNAIGATLRLSAAAQTTANGTLATVASVITSAGTTTLASLTMAPTSGGSGEPDGVGGVGVWNGTTEQPGPIIALNATEPTASTIVEPSADRLVELAVLCMKSLIFGSIIIGAVLGNALVIISVHKNRKLSSRKRKL